MALFLIEYLWDMVSLFHPDRIQITLSKAGCLAPFLYMIIMALAVVISHIPSVPLDVAAGAFFVPGLGTIYSAIGNYFGSILAVKRGLTLICGLIIVFFFFLSPLLIERYDLFSLRKFFQHAEQNNTTCGKS